MSHIQSSSLSWDVCISKLESLFGVFFSHGYFLNNLRTFRATVFFKMYKYKVILSDAANLNVINNDSPPGIQI